MGTGFKGRAYSSRSFGENLHVLKSNYKFSNGYFGIPVKGASHTRNIFSDDPLKYSQKFYDIASYGGIEYDIPNKGVYTKLADNTVITYRKISSSDGTPVIDINVNNNQGNNEVKQQKIHFVRRK